MGNQAPRPAGPRRRQGGRRRMSAKSMRVAVLMGGLSAEREVSLNSGRACAAALREKGYEITEIDVSRDMAALVKAMTPLPDAVFNALHGRRGEEACIQGRLELQQLPYPPYAVAASTLAPHK